MAWELDRGRLFQKLIFWWNVSAANENRHAVCRLNFFLKNLNWFNLFKLNPLIHSVTKVLNCWPTKLIYLCCRSAFTTKPTDLFPPWTFTLTTSGLSTPKIYSNWSTSCHRTTDRSSTVTCVHWTGTHTWKFTCWVQGDSSSRRTSTLFQPLNVNWKCKCFLYSSFTINLFCKHLNVF